MPDARGAGMRAAGWWQRCNAHKEQEADYCRPAGGRLTRAGRQDRPETKKLDQLPGGVRLKRIDKIGP